jgi:hypothetical protein
MNVNQTKKIVNEFSFFLRDKIGSGSSSDVFKGISVKTGILCFIQAKQLQ